MRFHVLNMAGGAVQIEIATGWTWTGEMADVGVTDDGTTLSESDMTDRVTVSATMVQVDLDGDWDNNLILLVEFS